MGCLLYAMERVHAHPITLSCSAICIGAMRRDAEHNNLAEPDTIMVKEIFLSFPLTSVFMHSIVLVIRDALLNSSVPHKNTRWPLNHKKRLAKLWRTIIRFRRWLPKEFPNTVIPCSQFIQFLKISWDLITFLRNYYFIRSSLATIGCS